MSDLECSHIENGKQKNAFHDELSEINLLLYIYALIKNKWWLVGVTIIGLLGGYVVAIVNGPRFISETVITAKETGTSNSSSSISRLGVFGGIVASQLNISQNPGLEKIDLILGSKKFNAELIERFNILPDLFRYEYPKEYEVWFDTLKMQWKENFNAPNMLRMGMILSGNYLNKEINNGVMTVSIESKDSLFTDRLIASYLEYLNDYIKSQVQIEAKENVRYLENQLSTISDPLLREKLQNLIANEMEKAMVVSEDAYTIIDPPLRIKRFKEKKVYPLLFGCGFFFITTFFIVVLQIIHDAGSDQRELVTKIKKELLKPF